MTFIAPIRPCSLTTKDLNTHWLDTTARLFYWYSPYLQVWMPINHRRIDNIDTYYWRIFNIMGAL